MRCFVAVPVSEDVRQAATQLQRELEQEGVRAKWVEGENLHLTLRFLGEIPESQASCLGQQLESLGEKMVPFWVQIGGLGTFPPRGRPRVIWAGVPAGAAELEALAREVNRIAVQVGLPGEERPWHAHLTLGRVKGACPRRALETTAKRILGRMLVQEMILYQSVLRPTGPIYRALRCVAFRGNCSL